MRNDLRDGARHARASEEFRPLATAGDGMTRVALITGAASGIGEAVARRLRDEGTQVMMADINADRLDSLAEDLGDPKAVDAVVTNVSIVADCERAVSRTIERFGRLDLVVTSAGVALSGPSDAMTESDWDRVMDVNLKGVFFVCRYAIPELERSGGNIVIIASELGLHGGSRAAIYCASKGGVVNLTRALALELAPLGVRVNAVCPADVDTPMTHAAALLHRGDDPEAFRRSVLARYPQRPPRFIRAEEVAELTAFLASDRAAAITGGSFPIDFGITAGIIRPAES